MKQGKELVAGFGLVIIASFMWLVSSCSQPVESSVPIKPPYVINSTSTKSSTPTTKPSIPDNSILAESQTTTTTIPTITDNSTAPESPTTTSSVLDVDINSYRLVIDGLVNTPLSLSYEQIQAYPTVSQNVELICPGVEDLTEEWTGVPVSKLLAKANLTPEASEVIFTGVK